MNIHSSMGPRFRIAGSSRTSRLQLAVLALCALVLSAVLLLAQQRQVPARSGGSYTGRIIFERSPTQLYLDIGPCGGNIVTFHQTYVYDNSSPAGHANCQGRQADLYTVTQN
jgi:hypothetical protein